MAQYFYDMSNYGFNQVPPLLGGISSLNGEILSRYQSGGNVGMIYIAPTAASLNSFALFADSYSDSEVLILASGSDGVPSEGFVNNGPISIVMRSDGMPSFYGRPNGYSLSIDAPAARSLTLHKIVSGSNIGIASASNVISAYGGGSRLTQYFYVRLRCAGTSIMAKMWREGTAEPAWQITVTDSSFTAGKSGIVFPSYRSNNMVVIKNVSLATAGDTAMVGKRIISGVVRSPATVGVGAGYIVRCYHRASGAILGETLTNLSGAYSFEVNLMQSEEIYCLAIDNLGNSWGIPTVDRPVS